MSALNPVQQHDGLDEGLGVSRLKFEPVRAYLELGNKVLGDYRAVILAGVGLYGVTAYTVAQRTNEFGIRMALGADRFRVLALVLRSAFMRIAVGLLLGLPLSVLAGRAISSQLYNVSFWDPLALALATGALALSAFLAAVIPASRAAGLSPIRALRTE